MQRLSYLPAGAAVRFAAAGQDLNRNIRQAAAQIATQVAGRVKSTAAQVATR